MKSGNLNFLEPSGPLQACNGTALPSYKIYKTHEPQSAYALHILHNKHEYGLINNTMTLLKHINKTPLLLAYEQLYPVIPPTHAAYFRTIHR